ncbi:MAG: flagellar biosynthesis anti-sigma factor FlgM [Thermodesulfobacteriota bacterium]|nr:flagellar biosynthesis anti-sigma factor FlgM [Thermodesulfobacteriota bacterium]
MKITENNPSVNLDPYLKNIKARKTADASAKGTPKEASREDEVVLSPQARKIQEAKKLLSAVSDIREEKVAQLRQEIENGTYQVDHKDLAAKIVRESLLNELF